MEKDYYQANIPSDAVRQLNEGLYQIQSEIDNIKVQVQQSKLQRKAEQTEISNSDSLERQNAKDFAIFSNRNETILNKLSDQILVLSNEVNELKKEKQQQLPPDEIAKAVSFELSKSFDALIADAKNSILEKVQTEFASLKETKFSPSEIVGEKIESKTQIDEIAGNVAIGVEQKLDLKFSEMFLELNNLIEKINSQKIEGQSEVDRKLGNIIDVNKQIVNRLNALTLKMNSLESKFETNVQDNLNARNNGVDNQILLDRFDKLAEYVAELVGTTELNNNNNIKSLNSETNQFNEKLNELTVLINSRKDLDFRPIYEILNELDEKLADIKYGYSDVSTTSNVTNEVDDETIKDGNENATRILSEIIPRIIRESIANSIVNVDDSESKGSFEKLTNQINLIFSNEEQKFAELFKQIAEIKDEIGLGDGIATETSEEFKPNEIEETLSSLRSELMSLSKLIADTESDEEAVEENESSIPKAISDATDTLDKLTKEIF